MDFQAFKACVAARAEALGIADYELYYQNTQSTSVSAYLHERNEFTSSTEGGVCFRCIVGGRMGYASTQALTEEAAASIVEHAADNAAVLETEEQEFLNPGGLTYAPFTPVCHPIPTSEELTEKVLAVQEEVYGADSAVIDGSSTEGFAEAMQIDIVNSRGLDLHYRGSVTGLFTAAVVSDGKEMADSYQFRQGVLSELDTGDMTKKAAASAVAKLGGDVAPTGVYPVVFSPDAMASILSTFQNLFSSEYAQKGLSRFAGQEGVQVASPAVTLMDDPFHSSSAMPIGFDAEGSPTACKAVIENGVLKTLLYNLRTAAVAGVKTTGNASKAGYAAPVEVRPFTMYIAPGTMTEEELLQKAGNGVYINFLGGLHAGANPITGDFSLQSAGFLIENGKKTTPVKSFTVAGNFYDLLKQITDVASNVEIPMPTGMTAFGAPSVLAANLSVAGK